MTTDLLAELLQKLDGPQARYHHLESYYNGTQPLSFLAPEAREALGQRFARINSNICRLAIGSLVERLRVVGFKGADVFDDWLRCDMDELSRTAHREALTLGQGYVIVWADKFGRPLITVESAREMAAIRDPGTRRLTAAIKRWETDTTTEAIVYQADQIVRYRANHVGATTAGFKVVEELPNPLGVPPVVRLLNSDRILDEGVSELDDLMCLTDALAKILADLMVSSEYVGRPRRTATGIELEEQPILDDDGNETGETVEVNPFPESNRMMVSENESAKFGQLDAADLSGYRNAVDVITTQISAVSALPGHMLGIMSNQPASADGLRAAESSLTARAEAKAALFGRSWEDVARLIVGVRDGADPQQVDVRVQWADPATRSEAQAADAVVKLFQSGLLPASYALKRLGYTDDDVLAIRAARRAEALDAQAVDLSRLVN